MSTNTLNNAYISVVMPVYNVERFVEDAIRSVLAQTFTDFELIIVNDFSSDNSLQLVQQFDDTRISIFNHTENRGLAGARNTGIQHAKGELIAFIDSDDMWHEDKLKLHVQHLDQRAEIGLSFSRSEFMESNGKNTGYYQMPKLKHISASDILCRNPIGNGSAPVIRRSVLEQISYKDNLYGDYETFYFDARLRRSEDIECWLRIALQTNWKIEGLPQALTYYRLNEGGLSSSLYAQYESWLSVIERTRLYAPVFIERWINRARAYQLRYIARQAIRLRMGDEAVGFFNKSMRSYVHIVVEEPARTLATMSAAYFMYLLPQDAYLKLESLASRLVSRLHKQRINRDLQMSS